MPAASVRAAVASLTFLTRVPLGRAVELDGTDVARGAALFPLVGAAVGAATGGVAVALHHVLPSLASAGVAVGVALVVTGAFHVDALADTADALGATTRERALEIMRDSRVGTFGAAAIAIDLLVKAAAIAALLERGGAWQALVAAGALARAPGPVLALVLPYPRAGGGPGSILTGRVGTLSATAGAASAVAISLVAGFDGLVLAGAVAVVAVVLGVGYARWLGGATGDCLGAVTELGETTALLVAAALA